MTVPQVITHERGGHGQMRAGTELPAGFDTVEIALFLAGAKPALLTHGREFPLIELRDWMLARGFAARLSDTQYELQDQSATGYSNLASIPVPARPGSNSFRWLATARSASRANRLWQSVTHAQDDTVGELLGYPACCRQTFARLWSQASAQFAGDVPLLQAFEDPHPSSPERPFPAHANVFVRYFGIELIQHFPCTPGCAPTATLAAGYRDVLGWSYPQAHSLLQDLRGQAILGSTGEVGFIRRDGAAPLISSTGPLRAILNESDWPDIIEKSSNYRVHWYA